MKSIEETMHVHVRPVSCKCSAPFLSNGSTNLSKLHMLKMISAILKGFEEVVYKTESTTV